MKLYFYFALVLSTAIATFAQTTGRPVTVKPAPSTISGFTPGAVSGFAPNAVSGFAPNPVGGFTPGPVRGFTQTPVSGLTPSSNIVIITGGVTPLTTTLSNNVLVPVPNPTGGVIPQAPIVPNQNIAPTTGTNQVLTTPLF